MKAVTIFISIFASSFSLQAQSNIDSVLMSIEKNNTGLVAIRNQIDAGKIKNKTGIYLQNPVVGFNYLWGNPSIMGNRTDISVLQTFDFPTVYSYKSKIANAQNGQADLIYQKERKSLLLQAQLICADLIFANIMKSEYNKRLNHAQILAKSYKSKFEAGEISILEYNKSQLNLLASQKDYEAIEIIRNSFLSELASLNGGIPLYLNDTMYAPKVIAIDFEQWYLTVEKENPELQWLKQECELNRMREQLSSSMSLPKFTTGYMSEKNVGQQFQGISIGLSIPLWENKNTTRYAKANTIATQSMEADHRITFHNKLKKLYDKAISLQKTVEDYRTTLNSINNSELLNQALAKGEISLIEYMMEISFYYSSINSMRETERDFNKAIAELLLYQ